MSKFILTDAGFINVDHVQRVNYSKDRDVTLIHYFDGPDVTARTSVKGYIDMSEVGEVICPKPFPRP